MRTQAAEAVLRARSPLAARFMTRIMRRHAARRFHAVRLARGTAPALPADAPVVVYSNHPSWWDPAVFMLLHRHALPQRAGFGPMEAKALARYGVLRRVGIFAIEPDTMRGAARFLAVADAVLARPRTALWVTAQGEFADPRARPLILRPGVAHLMRRTQGAIAVPLALEYPFWDESTPEALARFGAPLGPDPARTRMAWEALLAERLAETMDALAADAITRDAHRFETVVAGRAGVGGVYDAWRRARAALRGERAHLSHGERAR
jgi:1-acyl-sn-glycerol-3-phosphate acyltransferase